MTRRILPTGHDLIPSDLESDEGLVARVKPERVSGADHAATEITLSSEFYTPDQDRPTTHTPGPWDWEDTHDASCGRYCSPTGCSESHPSGRYQICGPEWDEDYLQAGVPAVGNKYDASLIAAAPDLLAALKGVLPFIDDASDVRVFADSAASEACRAAVMAVRAALKKAEGR